MSEYWTKKRVIARLKKYCWDENDPPTLGTLVNKCLFPIETIGHGAFRGVYGIVGTPFVIKLPHATGQREFNNMFYNGRECTEVEYEDNKDHAELEWEAYCDVLWGDASELQPYVPEIYCCLPYTSVILMKRYNVHKGMRARTVRKEVEAAAQRAYPDGTDDRDIECNNENIGYDPDTGRTVILDLGLLKHGQ